MIRAFVTGLSGLDLTDGERAFLKVAEPWGIILFRRNVGDPVQLRRLIGEASEAAGRALPVLVDQEGGRVQRLTQPHWRRYPSANRLAAAAAVAEDAALVFDVARLIAADLAAVGITVDCMPSLDLSVPGTSEVIGDRAYSADPHVVAACGRAAAEGMLAGGILPVIKHIPGHGRSMVDSHHALPVVTTPVDELAALDFTPFMALRDLPAAMTSHLLYTAVDADRPATQSPTVVAEIIRGLIGFDGLLFTDDLSMNALAGSLGERAARAAAAGCDILLHCNGAMDEMADVAAAAPVLAGRAAERAERALSAVAAGARLPLEGGEDAAILARLDAALSALDAGRVG